MWLTGTARLISLHPWRCSHLEWTWPWTMCCSRPCSEQGVDWMLMFSLGALKSSRGFLPWVSLSGYSTLMDAKLASTCKNTNHKCAVPTIFSHVQSRYSDTKLICEVCQEPRNRGDSLGAFVPQSRAALGSSKKPNKQWWDIGPTLCMLQWLSRSSPMD